MTTTPSDLVILRHLAARTHATASEVGAACRLLPGEIRPRLAALESHRLVGSRQDPGASRPRRMFSSRPKGGRRRGVDDDVRG